MKNIYLLLLFIFTTQISSAQFIKEKAINAQVGIGLSAPFDSATDVADRGFFAQGELVLKIASWVDLKPYAGFVITNSKGEDLNGDPTDEKAETQAFLIGGKFRVRAPIPWVAPYVELGIGSSIGSFRTLTVFDDIDKSGIIYHIPFAFGLELGRNHNFDLGFSYFFQPSVEQFAGAFAIGLTIPLKN